MTSPEGPEGLVERLRAEEIDPYAPGLRHTSFVNPDGPEAAAEIERLSAALSASREALSFAERSLTGIQAGLMSKGYDYLAAMLDPPIYKARQALNEGAEKPDA